MPERKSSRPEQHPDRRAVLAGMATALVVAIVRPVAATAAGGDFGAFIRIAADGSVAIVAPCFELGQGSQTGLGMIVADELGADWARVAICTPELDPAFRTPGRTVQNTSGSQMVRRWFLPLRLSAAVAREMLTAAAAARWSVPLTACVARDGLIQHVPSGREASFASLVAEAAVLPRPVRPVLRTDLALIGTSIPRHDIPAKVDGSARYGIDVRLPGLRYAAIRQAPVFGATLSSVDGSVVEGRRGVVAVVRLPGAVAVVADSFWRARTAVEALSPVFSEGANANVTSSQIAGAQALRLSGEATSAIQAGDAAAGFASGRVIEADYAVPFLAHASMEPMTCTAHVTADSCQVWVPTQDLTTAAATASKTTGLPPSAVQVHATYCGGAFGRKFEQDFVAQATAIAKAVQRPVQLIWTREEDLQHDFYRPAMSARLGAAVDHDGAIQAFRIRLAGPSIVEHTIGTPLVKGTDPAGLLGISTETSSAPGKLQQYDIPSVLAEFAYQPTTVPIGYWRAVGASHNGFFIESFIDELAFAAQQDPYAYRRRLLARSPRALAVLDRAAAEAGWGRPLAAGRFRGIAFSECVGSFVAEVAEVSVTGGAITVHRVVGVIDCGTAVNPDSVKAQMQGCITMGLSAALLEEVMIDQGRAVQSNFHDYPVLKMADAPAIEVHLIESGGEIGGAGEAGLPAIAPAVANAVFAATGVRLRSLPLKV